MTITPVPSVRVLLEGRYLLAGQRPPEGCIADECEWCGHLISVQAVNAPPGADIAVRCTICYRAALQGRLVTRPAPPGRVLRDAPLGGPVTG